MEFKQRTTKPESDNRYYIHTSKCGYNKCIIRDSKTGNVLPNCVGYSYGRFMECQGIIKCNLSRGNAKDWYNYKDGYKRGKTPKLGAVACWTNDGAGHVANVEKIYNDGSFLVSQSNYSGTIADGRYFETKVIPKSCKSGTKVFQGFIYTDIEFDEKIPNKVYRKGDKGDAVKKIDQFLYGKYKDSKVLGEYYGINTEKYMKQFQTDSKAKGIYDDKIDGICGPKTQNAMRLDGFIY